MHQFRTYPLESVIFRKTTEQWGGLSNMCAGFGLSVNQINIQSSEILYQACRFPHHPSLQEEILKQTNPMIAKRISRDNIKFTRSEWEIDRIRIMKWVVFVKLCQNWDEFFSLLSATGHRPIVEHSEKDQFWGAKKNQDHFYGINALGRILMYTRDTAKHRNQKNFSYIPPVKIPHFLLLGNEITAVYADDVPQHATLSMF